MAVYRAGENLVSAFAPGDGEPRNRTLNEIRRREARCGEFGKIYARAMETTSKDKSLTPLAKAPAAAPAPCETALVPKGAESGARPARAISPLDADGTDARTSTPPGGSESKEASFADKEYQTASNEIRERVQTENVLFALKFTLVGGILAVLFSLFRKKEEHEFERFVQDRRAAVFFIAALLASTIVDTRLRFNSKIIESLGDWVWCMESGNRAISGQTIGLTWEHFLHIQLDGGSYPIMRYFCHFLTPLLFSVTVYLFVVLARTMHRSSMMMMVRGGFLFFVLLAVISLAHSPIAIGENTREYPWLNSRFTTLMASIVVGLLGFFLLRQVCRMRFAVGNAFTQTKDIVLSTAPEERESVLKAWIQFAAVSCPEDLLQFVKDLAEKKDQGELQHQMVNIITGLKNQGNLGAKIVFKPGSGWGFNDSRGRFQHTRGEIHRRLRQAVSGYSGDVAEDQLWKLYFNDREREAGSE